MSGRRVLPKSARPPEQKEAGMWSESIRETPAERGERGRSAAHLLGRVCGSGAFAVIHALPTRKRT
eukprot:7243058-Prymnesium_polylepis.1